MSDPFDSGALTLAHLSMGYADRRILVDVTPPALQPGTITALLGPNAAGKSTLLRGIAGLHPMRGDVLLGGRRLPAAERSRHMVYLPQTLPHRSRLDVFEAVLSAAMVGAPRRLLSRPAAEATAVAAVDAVLSRLDITHLADLPLATLSGGQRQLVGLAQALVRRPRVLLLDEPTSALDLRHQYQVIETIGRETRQHGLITLIVLHDIGMALTHADQVVVLHAGQMAGAGAPATVIDAALLARVYGVRGGVDRVREHHVVLVEGLAGGNAGDDRLPISATTQGE